MTWRAGVDVLCLGGSKNGMAVGEAVVFFDRTLSAEFAARCKQAGQLASKMCFLAAPWAGVLEGGAWLRHAAHANAMAQRLAAGLVHVPGVRRLYPVQANSVFVDLPPAVADRLRERGWAFYAFIGGGARLMCSWDTQPKDVDAAPGGHGRRRRGGRGGRAMKISIIGPGKVGAAVGLVVVARRLAEELVLVGRRPGPAAGEAADLLDASSFGPPIRVVAGGVAETADSDVVVISLSVLPFDLAVGRNGHAAETARTLRDLVPELARVSPNAVIVVASNPLDALTTFTLRLSGLPPERVIGTGTVLDTMRLRVRLSQECGIHPNDVRVYVLGEHGDGQFAALSTATIGGAPVRIPPERLRALEQETRVAGHAITRNKGYTNQGIAIAVAELIAAIASDGRVVLPVSTLITNVAGVNDVCLSLPVVVGRGGVCQRLAVVLSDEETAAFRRCGKAVAATVRMLDEVV